jgi:CHAT domain-containing protein
VIQARTNNPSARARHEAGAAYLLIDRDRDAIDALESAVRQSPKETAYWSDLAAARYTLAVREKRPHELPQALADADHALRLQPALPDALFNRALIIESLGVTEAARRAWQRYVAADPSTHWSTEAMHHLGNLRVVTTRDEFQHHLAVASRAFRTGNDAPLVALARNYPQEARTWSEGPLLAKWADAIHKNDAKTAIETLSIVRKLGASLAEFNGVQTLADIVAAIDRADTEQVRILADAHATYRDGRVLYRDRRVADAQQQLRRAEELFTRSGSPMALITKYYLASCLYDSNHVADAKRALEDVAATFDPQRYPGLAAEIKWEQTLCHASEGQWEAAIRKAAESRQIFSKLGETENRGQMDVLLASYFSHISQPAPAWKARVAALSVLSRSGSSDGIRNSLIGGIYAEAAQGKTEAALALTGIALDDLRAARQPLGVTLAESARAEAFANLSDSGAAQGAVDRARKSAKTMADVELRKRYFTAIDIAEAVVVRDTRPAISLQLLDAAIAFYTSHEGNAWLPKAYLERGLTHARAKHDAQALTDFESGIRELDAQRSSIRQKELRGNLYDTAPQLFSELISLLLRHGNIERAFEISDSARARSIYEQFGTTQTPERVTISTVQKALPQNAVLLEYAFLRDSLLIFYVSQLRSGVVRVGATPATIQGLIEHCDSLLKERADSASVQRTTAALYQLLIAPITSEIVGSDSLIIVPDRQLHTVPFAALLDLSRNRYLIDDVALSIAPSAASVLRQVGRNALSPVLVVADPRNDDAPNLPAAEREAEAVAAIYESSTLLRGDRATRARFIAAARTSGMIHYAGHADSESAEPVGTLHLAADGHRGSGDLDASAISALHLEKAPLVILAACGTMRGDSAHLEGMPSIATAFLAAGASSVVGTLWEVDDETAAPLFRRMHLELRRGANPSTALRTAQLALAHASDSRLSHPSTWAPVQLLGYTKSPMSGAKRSE